MTLNPDPLYVPDDYSSPGERCPVTDPFWCSRDRYHSGAHVNRSATGPGLIGWPNTTEPVGSVHLPDRPRSGAILVWIVLALGIAALALLVANRGAA